MYIFKSAFLLPYGELIGESQERKQWEQLENYYPSPAAWQWELRYIDNSEDKERIQRDEGLGNPTGDS